MSEKKPKSSATGKRRHATYGDALAALIRIQEESPKEGVGTAYQCDVCDDWHVSHKRFTLVKPRGRGKRRRRLVL